MPTDHLSEREFVALANAIMQGHSWEEAKARCPTVSDAALEAAKADAYLALAQSIGKVPPCPEQLFKVDAMNTEQVHLLGDLLARGLTWDQAKAKFHNVTHAALEGHRAEAEAWAADHPTPLAAEYR
jgi:hypothetical protein